jgi:hypothetical protein
VSSNHEQNLEKFSRNCRKKSWDTKIKILFPQIARIIRFCHENDFAQQIGETFDRDINDLSVN